MPIRLVALSLVLAIGATNAVAIDFSAVIDPIDDYLTRPFRTEPARLVIRHFDGTTLIDQSWGGMQNDTVVPIASATKWLSGVAIMSLVDDGLLDLDQPVDEVLPIFAGHPAADMTVRQMFSHTGGAPGGSDWVNAKNITLAQSVAGIAGNETWLAEPGEQFYYGGVSMQIAGRVAEVVAGQSWDTIFRERVLSPLDINDTDFQGLGPTINRRIAGGAQSSVASYERLLKMFVDGGVYEGQRVLSEAAIATMLSDQTAGATLVDASQSLEEYLGYGIGGWVFRRDCENTPVEFASPGAFGAVPWIDFENRYYGLFLVDDALSRFAPLIDDLRAFTREALSLGGDYNLDGEIDEADLIAWRYAYGTAGYSHADGNRDGRVDAADYTLWREAMPSTTAARRIPEPSAVLLVALAWLGSRRRSCH